MFLASNQLWGLLRDVVNYLSIEYMAVTKSSHNLLREQPEYLNNILCFKVLDHGNNN